MSLIYKKNPLLLICVALLNELHVHILNGVVSDMLFNPVDDKFSHIIKMNLLPHQPITSKMPYYLVFQILRYN